MFRQLHAALKPHGFILAGLLNPWFLGDARYPWWRQNLPRLIAHGGYSVAGGSGPISRVTARALAREAAPWFDLARIEPTGLSMTRHLFMSVPAGSPGMLRVLRAGVSPIPQWATIGLSGSQNVIRAQFATGDDLRDVTDNHTVSALNPLSIGIGDAAARASGRLIYRDMKTDAVLGWLELRSIGTIDDIGLFEVAAGDHRCVSWPLRPWSRYLQRRAQRRQRAKPDSLSMSPDAAQHLMIAYILPRPVVLVSVVGSDHRNLFPMDLIGPLGGERFALALHLGSVSGEVVRDQGRIVLSDPPASSRDIVYALGRRHCRPLNDWSELPFDLRPSEQFGIPAMAMAPRVRELVIEQSRAVGSHRLFIGRVITDQVRMGEPQLHHTAGFHQYYRIRRNAPLPTA